MSDNKSIPSPGDPAPPRKVKRVPPPPIELGGSYFRTPLFLTPGEYRYGDEFPQAARAKIKLAELKAVDERMTQIDGTVHMMRPFIDGARELGMRGSWSVDDMDREIKRFLVHLAIYQDMVHGPYSDPDDRLTKALRAMREYRKALCDVAEAQIAKESSHGPVTPPAREISQETRAQMLESVDPAPSMVGEPRAESTTLTPDTSSTAPAAEEAPTVDHTAAQSLPVGADDPPAVMESDRTRSAIAESGLVETPMPIAEPPKEPAAGEAQREADVELENPLSEKEARMAERRKLRDDYFAAWKRVKKKTYITVAQEANPTTAHNKGWNSRYQLDKWLHLDPLYEGEPDRRIREVLSRRPNPASKS
jgi:hypothetical protein